MDKVDFIRQYINKMKNVQEAILDFINNESYDEVLLEDIKLIIDQLKIQENRHELILLLDIISKISCYHFRTPDFFHKIEQILLFLKDSIKKWLSNIEIFRIFAESFPIIAFLFEEKILIADSFFFDFFFPEGCFEDEEPFIYFIPEFMNFFTAEQIEKLKKKYPHTFEIETFNKKKRIGENDSYICQLIRDDSVEEFIAYVNRSNLSLSETTIGRSDYETNFMINEETTLIEYAAFYGSIQIFQYLQLNKVELNSSLWKYAIHSNKPEMIHLLEDLHIESKDTYKECFIRAIKCHHNEVARYIKEKIMDNEDIPNAQNLLFFNFSIFLDIFDDDFNILNDKSKLNGLFYDLCNNECYVLVDFLLQNFTVDVNTIIILSIFINHIFIFIFLNGILYLY